MRESVKTAIAEYLSLGWNMIPLKGLLEALEWHKGMALKLEKNADGSVTVRKA
jgi:hypothetical protein